MVIVTTQLWVAIIQFFFCCCSWTLNYCKKNLITFGELLRVMREFCFVFSPQCCRLPDIFLATILTLVVDSVHSLVSLCLAVNISFVYTLEGHHTSTNECENVCGSIALHESKRQQIKDQKLTFFTIWPFIFHVATLAYRSRVGWNTNATMLTWVVSFASVC